MVGIYGIFENLFRFWRFRCSGNYLLLKKITTLILICKVTVKSSCLSYWFCISFISFYSSSVKRLRDSNLLYLYCLFLSFAISFGVTNFLIWLLPLLFLFWKYSLLHFEFSLISLMIAPFLWSSLLRIELDQLDYWLTLCFHYLIKLAFQATFLWDIYLIYLKKL